MIRKPSRRGSAFVLMLLLPLVVWARGGAWAGQLTATWVAGSTDELGFSVERREDTLEPFVEVGITDPGVTGYTDTTVAEGATYCYRVRAFSAAGYSDYSNVACATTGTDTVLAVVAMGTGEGRVISVPPGILCGANCSSAYPKGTVVTLLAVPTGGSTFAGWDGAACSGAAQCIVILNETTMVRATFELSTPSFATLTVDRDGKGMITSSPAGIRCGRACRETYASDTPVTLVATAYSGSSFIGWSGGGCSGTDSCTVILTSSTTVSAVFAKGVAEEPVLPRSQ